MLITILFLLSRKLYCYSTKAVSFANNAIMEGLGHAAESRTIVYLTVFKNTPYVDNGLGCFKKKYTLLYCPFLRSRRFHVFFLEIQVIIIMYATYKQW